MDEGLDAGEGIQQFPAHAGHRAALFRRAGAGDAGEPPAASRGIGRGGLCRSGIGPAAAHHQEAPEAALLRTGAFPPGAASASLVRPGAQAAFLGGAARRHIGGQAAAGGQTGAGRDQSRPLSGQQGAAGHRQHLQAAAPAQAQAQAAAVGRAEGEFHLVAEGPLFRGAQGGPQGQGGIPAQAADALQGIAHQLAFPAQLGRIGQALPGAAAAILDVGADVRRQGHILQHRRAPGLPEAFLAADDAGPHRLAGQGARDEDDGPSVLGAVQAAAVVGQGVDAANDLVGHGGTGGWGGGGQAGEARGTMIFLVAALPRAGNARPAAGWSPAPPAAGKARPAREKSVVRQKSIASRPFLCYATQLAYASVWPRLPRVPPQDAWPVARPRTKIT